MNNTETSKQQSSSSQNTLVSIINISASLASLAAFIVMIFEKTDLPIKWGSLAGVFLFSLSLISTFAGAIYIVKYIHSKLKNEDTLTKVFIWPISILVLCFLLFIVVVTCYLFLYDGISEILNNSNFV